MPETAIKAVTMTATAIAKVTMTSTLKAVTIVD
jgi:hypothetical protein